MSYYNLLSHIPENSLLITGDLADEIFGFERREIINSVVFNDNEIQNLLAPSSSLQKHRHSLTPDLNEDIDIWYDNITYKMIYNCLIDRDISYFPFFVNYYPFHNNIMHYQIKNENKTYLKDFLSTNFNINIIEKKQGFKYPILDSVLDEYYKHIIYHNGEK
jgi:hypothetical protein